MATPDPRVPAIAWFYGVAGLIPFIGCALADIGNLAPGREAWRFALIAYSAVILSFLGGGRWGFELGGASVRPRVITLSMAPSIAAFFLLLTPPAGRTLALGCAAVAHLLQWLWDVLEPGAPPGYARLRTTLAGVAVLAIVAALPFA